MRHAGRSGDMNSLVVPVAVVGLIATTLMVVAMLYFVWLSIGDDTHAPRLEDGDETAEPSELTDADGN